MSNFFLFSTHQPLTLAPHARILFHELKGLAPATQWSGPSGEVLVFDARASRTPQVARAVDSNTWLMAVGTWFDETGLGIGDEAKLLMRISRDGLPAVMSTLEGFFVLLIGNDVSGEVSVITDLGGSCHCYLRELADGIAISTSSAVLAALGEVQLDPIGAQEFLTTGVIYEERSLWRYVSKLAPAQILTLRQGRVIERTKYWRFANIVPQRYGLDESVERIATALTSAARRIGQRFSKPLCDLTGGYDSRATIAGFMLAEVPTNTTVSGAPDSPDVIVSTQIAAAFGLSHRRITRLQEITLELCAKAFAYTDGEFDLFEYARIAATHEGHATAFDISINGSFGELARGYWWELLLPNLGVTKKLDYSALASKRYAALPYDSRIFVPSLRIPLAAHFTEALARAGHDLESFPNTSQMDNAYYSLRMQRWQGRIASSTNHIWPAISPYAFRSLLIPVLETQWQARIRSLLVRAMLQRKLPKLANIPLEHGYPAVPATMLNLFRFWRVPAHYADRIYRKVRRMSGFTAAADANSGPLSVASALGQSDEARALLKFTHLRDANLIDTPHFGSFVDGAQGAGFAYTDQYTRIISLEYALSRLNAARGQCTASSLARLQVI